MQNTYGILTNDQVHIDVSNTERGAKNYATRHGYTTITIRYNGGYIASQIAYKENNKWITIKH